SPAPAPQAKCTKRADPDPKILPACKPPPIRDRKTESANPRYGEGFFSKLLEHFQKRMPCGKRLDLADKLADVASAISGVRPSLCGWRERFERTSIRRPRAGRLCAPEPHALAPHVHLPFEARGPDGPNAVIDRRIEGSIDRVTGAPPPHRDSSQQEMPRRSGA